VPAQSTYTPIATLTYTSNANFVFNNIPQNYTDLVIAGNVRGVNGGPVEYLLMKLNALSATQSFTPLTADGSSTASQRNNPSIGGGFIYQGLMTGGTATSGIFSSVLINISNYSNSTTNKMTLSRMSADANGSGVTSVIAGVGLTTSPVTSVTLLGSNGTVGSLTIYGIAAA
jgi:hypothetical protein